MVRRMSEDDNQARRLRNERPLAVAEYPADEEPPKKAPLKKQRYRMEDVEKLPAPTMDEPLSEPARPKAKKGTRTGKKLLAMMKPNRFGQNEESDPALEARPPPRPDWTTNIGQHLAGAELTAKIGGHIAGFAGGELGGELAGPAIGALASKIPGVSRGAGALSEFFGRLLGTNNSKVARFAAEEMGSAAPRTGTTRIPGAMQTMEVGPEGWESANPSTQSAPRQLASPDIGGNAGGTFGPRTSLESNTAAVSDLGGASARPGTVNQRVPTSGGPRASQVPTKNAPWWVFEDPTEAGQAAQAAGALPGSGKTTQDMAFGDTSIDPAGPPTQAMPDWNALQGNMATEYGMRPPAAPAQSFSGRPPINGASQAGGADSMLQNQPVNMTDPRIQNQPVQTMTQASPFDRPPIGQGADWNAGYQNASAYGSGPPQSQSPMNPHPLVQQLASNPQMFYQQFNGLPDSVKYAAIMAMLAGSVTAGVAANDISQRQKAGVQGEAMRPPPKPKAVPHPESDNGTQSSGSTF